LIYHIAVQDPPPSERWRQTHLGRLLARASERFEARVLAVMAHDEELTLALSNLARRGRLTASHIQLTRHLPLLGCSLTTLASRAGVTKQAMGKLVDQCAAWGLVQRMPDTRDARSVRVTFTPTGMVWLGAYQLAVRQAETEFSQAVGPEVATVVHLGIEAYTS
jgi:DNA-binding MarR family transcriptional regulator